VRDQAELGRQHDLVAPARHRACDEFFVDVRAVDLGGVDQRDAEIDGSMNCPDGFGVVTARAGVGDRHAHRAESEASDLQIGEVSLFHGASPGLVRLWADPVIRPPELIGPPARGPMTLVLSAAVFKD
jgi:hypothetical protein